MSADHAPTRLMVLAFSDVVDSVALKRRLGDTRAAQLIREHDELVRRVLADIPEGELLKDTGDGFLARFDTVSSAVTFALRFQQAMRTHGWNGQSLQARVGLHLGEVSELDPEPGGGLKLSGLAVDLTARLMGLALGGQILMTRALFDNARQFVRDLRVDRSDDGPGRIVWMAHGQYVFKGYDDPVEVFEVGLDGAAPLAVPPDGEKAHRALAPGEEETLGWRPAGGLEVPGRPGWILERRIGEGGYGEVWLGIHTKTKAPRAFKFCFDVDRLRSLKRELTLFRLLREVLGDRDDIARIYEVQLDEAPFFLEGEYTEAGDLVTWAQNRGGLARVPIETKLDIVRRVAVAAAAAHSVGILHKDIKPSNILIHEVGQGPPRPRLADFGIGMLIDPTSVAGGPITMAGFTEVGSNESSRTGTRLYAPPESLAGKAFTVQGDVYALGVLLYQMVIGDLNRPLATGWEREISDALLVEDIGACVQGDRDRRLQSAHELADRLATLDQRRAQRLQEAQQRLAAARRRRRARFAVAVILSLTTLLAIVAVGLVRENRLRRMAQAESDRNAAIVSYYQDMFERAQIGELGRKARITQVLESGIANLASLKDQPVVQGTMQFSYGNLYLTLGLTDEAEKLLSAAIATLGSAPTVDDRLLLRARARLGYLHMTLAHLEQAESLMVPAYERYRAQYGIEDRYTLELMNDLAMLRHEQGRDDEAIALYREALDTHLRLESSGQGDAARWASESMIVTNNYAKTLADNDKIDQAQAIYVESLRQAQESLGDDHPVTLAMINNYGSWLNRQRRYAESAALMVPLLQTVEDVLGRSNPDAIVYQIHAAAAMVHTGDESGRNILQKIVSSSDEPTPAILFAQQELARALVDLGALDEADPIYQRVLSARREFLGIDDKRTLNTMNDIAWLYEDQGQRYEDQGQAQESQDRFGAAEQIYKQQIGILESVYGSDDEDTIGAKNNYAHLLLILDRLDEARAMYAQVVQGADRTMEAGDYRRWFFHGRYGQCLLAMEDYPAAEGELQIGYEGLARIFGNADSTAQDILKSLIECETALRHTDKVDEYRSKLVQP